MFFSVRISLLRKLSIRDVKLLSSLEVAEPEFRSICKIVYMCPALASRPSVLSICYFSLSEQASPWSPFGSVPLPPDDALSVISFLFTSSTSYSLLTLFFCPRNILKILTSLKKSFPVTKWLSSYLPISHLSSNGTLLGKGPKPTVSTSSPSHPLLN